MTTDKNLYGKFVCKACKGDCKNKAHCKLCDHVWHNDRPDVLTRPCPKCKA